MCRGLAPTAMRRPISRVRSVTLTSMMFMMPMPPTSSETAAMLASSSGQRLGALLLARRDLGQVADREVVLAADARCVAIAQQRRDLAAAPRRSTSSDVASTRIVPGTNFCRPPWIFARNVVTGTNTTSSWSLPLGGLSLARSTPTTWNGTLRDAHRLADGSALAPNRLVGDGLAEHDDLGRRASTSACDSSAPGRAGQLRMSK